MDRHVLHYPLFVFKLTTSCEKCLKKLRKGLLECRGIVSVEVNEENKEVRVRGNVEPLELILETQTLMGEKAKLAYYNKDPVIRDDFKRECNGNGNGKEKEKEEDHYKPYVYKEHEPVYYQSSMSGKEFFDYFGGVRSETHKRNDVPTGDPSAEFPDCSHSRHFNPAVPMQRRPYTPHFY